MEKAKIRIAIDGPAGAGKSTMAKRLALALGIDYIDTGAMYRAIALKLVREGVDYRDEPALKELLSRTDVDFEEGHVLLDGEVVDAKIRTPEVSKMASDSSAILTIREKLVALQRAMGEKKSLVMDGRDIGTNVLKDAEYKFYLTATPAVRALRRAKEMEAKGDIVDLAQVEADIVARDLQDSTREHNPLRKADDAIEIDSSFMEIAEVVEMMMNRIKEEVYMEHGFPFTEISGTEYEMGLKIGALFKDALREGADQAAVKLEDEAIRKDFETVKQRLEKEYPDSLEHAYGRADGAGADRDSYLLFLCYELWEDRGKDRCSDIIVSNGGHVVMGHNEDGPYSLDNSALIKYKTNKGWFFDFSTPDALAGGSFGFSSAGLVFTMNYMYIETLKRDKVPVWFFLRSLVECQSIEEIKEKLAHVDIASGFHWNFFIGGKAYEVEAKYDRAELNEVNGIFVHTNHYLNPSMDEGYSDPETNSLFRYAKIKELMKKKGDIEWTTLEIENILKYKSTTYYNSIFETPEMGQGITACTVLFDSVDGSVKYINNMLEKSHTFFVGDKLLEDICNDKE